VDALRLLVCLFTSCLIAPGPARSGEADKEISNSIGMKLVRIPAGKFVMGSPATEAEREAGEEQHEVTITRPFYLGVHTVTQGQFGQVMGKNPSFFGQRNGGSSDHPAEQVRWNEAREFCAKLSALPEEMKAGRTYRLPSEAEWEYACRAGTTTPFNFGDALSSKQANFNGNFPYGRAEKGPFLHRTAKVGSYPPNAWGLYDMHGNIYEWCNDWYDSDYYKRSPQENPKGPESGAMPTGFGNNFFVVVRGGCWLDEGRACRSARRFRLQQSEPYRWTGFRVACDTVGK
jgi:formylglycine-generating enzyme required for sulfatase activity